MKSAKIVNINQAVQISRRWRMSNETFSFTNGVFDLELHPGHLHSFNEAAALADHLIVGVNSDSSAKRLGKGPGRPRISEIERANGIAAVGNVDLVLIFEESTPFEVLSELKPDYLVKGDDYRLEDVIGREFAKEVVLIKRLKDYSTTALDKEIYGGKEVQDA